MTTDMSVTTAVRSDQLNADDLIGGPITIRVSDVGIAPSDDQPVTVRYDGDAGKPFRPCKLMRRVMIHAWGPDASKYAGHSMTLYRDPAVKFGGLVVGGIRISHMTGLTKPLTVVLQVSKGKQAPFTVKPLAAAELTESATPKRTVQSFLAEVGAALLSAETADAVEAIVAGPDVVMALEKLPPRALDALNEIIAAARLRTTPAADLADESEIANNPENQP